MATTPLVITIGRQFGSGGRVLGRALADALGLPFYDKELLAQAAEAAGMSPRFLERNDERRPRFMSGLLGLAQGYVPLGAGSPDITVGSDSVYAVMSNFIRDLAARESCVIVGRTADFVLRDHPNCLNLFVHAPLDHCVERILRRGDCADPDQARALALRSNKARAAYYNFFTDKQWGAASSYHLCIDSSRLTLDAAVDLVKHYLGLRLSADGAPK